MATKPRVVAAAPLTAAGLELLGARFVVEAGSGRSDPAWLREHLHGAAALVTEPAVRVDRELLDSAGGSLKVVANFGVGYDHIDLQAARALGVRVTNTPGVLTNATAELTVALMLAAARRIVDADAFVRGGHWAQGAEPGQLGRELASATVGLVGFGRIGRRVAELIGGFRSRVLFSAPEGTRAEHGAERCELQELLAASDFISLHVPLTPQTTHLIDADALGKTKPGAILVNTSRGAVVDSAALIEALRSGALAAAGLDVYEGEPQVPEALRELPNTVLLPHLGSATVATRDAMARLCAENVIAVIDGREPPAAVI